MTRPTPSAGWNFQPPCAVEPENRAGHVRACSDFAAGLLERFPDWRSGLDQGGPPDRAGLAEAVRRHGLERGLRRFRNREMLGIIWRDLCGLAPLSRTFTDLVTLAETSPDCALGEHYRSLQDKHGTPRGPDGEALEMFVIGLGKFGGGELNLSSDIDIMFCYPVAGECDGPRGLSNERFFTRLARAVIASLSEITEDGFCFRVDTRLRPFGNAGPLVSTLAALEQYYQREGRDWERYALVKARPVAGDRLSAKRFIDDVRPFVYRRYIDYSAVESLQEMHASVQEDARRKDRLDDIKRGPGGIREIEFLAQCFQILRGGREPGLQTPRLDRALEEIGKLGLLEKALIESLREDYAFLRFVENRIQALRDQQTHRVPAGNDRERIAEAMGFAAAADLDRKLDSVRKRISKRFHDIFPARSSRSQAGEWQERWRQAQNAEQTGSNDPLDHFGRRLQRIALSQRADQRLNRLMPALLEQMAQRSLSTEAANRVFDLVLAICRRSAYLVLLEQHEKALARMLDLFSSSGRIAEQVIRFPALLDELIDPALGAQIPGQGELTASVERILGTGQDTEAQLNALNYLKLATELRIAVGQLQKNLDATRAQRALADLAAAILHGVLMLAGSEIEHRHGVFESSGDETDRGSSGLAVIGYGSLGAAELSYGSDLDIVFLFAASRPESNGKRPLAPEHYYARLAQRLLSFLTVMTPSGKLYEVDTRLRPNGQAGSLVSSMKAFRDYQSNEAWTWEFQALTRARFLAGSPALGARFEQVRTDVLCRKRDAGQLAREMRDMRRRIADNRGDEREDEKHRAGGLIDIEFIAQLGILARAHANPSIVEATETTDQLNELLGIGWLSQDELDVLVSTMHRLRESRMMRSLVKGAMDPHFETGAVSRIFEKKFENP
jgi:glutamate-ammonia-ligase adenylyltransferase